jgi:hypothetical protein
VASASGRSPDPSTGTPTTTAPTESEQVEHRRERRVLHEDVVAEAHRAGGDPVQRVQRAVDDGDPLGREREALAQRRSRRAARAASR